METISKKLKKANPLSIEKVYDLDPNNPDDVVEIKKIKLLNKITNYMVDHEINMSELARKMNKTRQEVSRAFSGKNLTMEFLMKAAVALDLSIEIVTIDKDQQKPSWQKVFNKVAVKKVKEIQLVDIKASEKPSRKEFSDYKKEYLESHRQNSQNASKSYLSN